MLWRCWLSDRTSGPVETCSVWSPRLWDWTQPGLTLERRLVKQQVVKVLRQQVASPVHMDGSLVFTRWRQCTSRLIRTSKSQAASRSVQPFLHSSRQSVPVLYDGLPLPFHNYPLSMGAVADYSIGIMHLPRARVPRGTVTRKDVGELCKRVIWGYWKWYHLIDHIGYNFLLAFHSNCAPVLYRSGDTARYWSKIYFPTPSVIDAPVDTTPLEFQQMLWR